ncbi:hypothetical protein LEP1GSC060_2165 [Leptospira weilii serovar Ranarum str. ICFT]|nr:hypothetical protein LEP1GSC060_2165 [Leptospira weilii serovar Ranarum str. ICFT]
MDCIWIRIRFFPVSKEYSALLKYCKFGVTHAKALTRPYHSVAHKYLDLKINLSELRQSSVERSGGFSLSENHTFCK